MDKPLKFCIATSYAAKDAIQMVANEFNKIDNVYCEVCPVKSNYWGEDINVAGLITSDDLINTIKDKDVDFVVLPSVMLRQYSEDFLDGKNLSYVKKVSKQKFFVVQNHYSMKELIDYLITYV